MKVDGDDDLFIVLGLDFGTSSTKLIVRLHYEPGQPSIAIPAPAFCQSNNHPYLWQTVIWLNENSEIFSPYPEEGATVLNNLKHGLIQWRSDSFRPEFDSTFKFNPHQAVVAYLAFVIRYTRGWLLLNRPKLFRGRKPVWFVNLGMPSASYDDEKLTKLYRCVGAAALQLAKFDKPIKIDTVRLFLDDSNVVKSRESKEAAEELGINVIPEAAAEMTCFAKSTRSASGLYLMVDVGAMTLDACMFRLNQVENKPDRFGFMAADVRPLGVDSLHWFLCNGKTKQEFVEQCNRMLRKIIVYTKRHRDPNASNWKPGGNTPIFLAGGGAANSLHQDIIIKDLDNWLKKYNSGNDGLLKLEFPPDNTLDLPETITESSQIFGRMAVAWGLSYPPTEIGDIASMREIENIPLPTKSENSNKFIGPEQV
ncbi:MAG: hypothetical protein OXD01_06805 [Gammaproteobacteria bacterium]|nr:hypothetical protein [Gammaproteobacteria bacterium]